MIRNLLIASLVSLLIGGVAGWRIEAKLAHAAELKAQVASLTRQVEAAEAAAAADQVQYQVDQGTIEELQKKIEDANAKAHDGECLNGDDARRVRNLWNRSPSH